MEDKRIDEIAEFIAALARLDFSERLPSESDTSYGAIADGLNWLAEELEYSVVSREKLEMKNKELETFAYIVSHDLKAPLRAINTLATFIAEDLKDKNTEEVFANLSLLQSRVARMDNLIKGILQYSRLGEANMTSLNLQEIVNTIISDYQDLKNVQINIEGHLPSIQGDQTQITQVFGNLINNGIKYNDKAVIQIDISAEIKDNQIQIKVKDNGPGIAQEYHKKVFEIFQTLQSKDTIESTGVGLTIVQKIMMAHNGSVQVDSDGKNGTTMILIFPN